MHMKKIVTLCSAMLLCCSLAMGEVVISLSENTVDFGTVDLKGHSQIQDHRAVVLNHATLVNYQGINYEYDGPDETADGATFWFESEYRYDGYIYPYEYNHSTYDYDLIPSSDVVVYYQASEPGTYAGKFSFYTQDEDGNDLDPIYLDVKLVVTDSPTAIDEIVNGQSSNRKLIRDGQLLILRDGRTYTLTGQELR